jgi:hypothetical protein
MEERERLIEAEFKRKEEEKRRVIEEQIKKRNEDRQRDMQEKRQHMLDLGQNV